MAGVTALKNTGLSPQHCLSLWVAGEHACDDGSVPGSLLHYQLALACRGRLSRNTSCFKFTAAASDPGAEGALWRQNSATCELPHTLRRTTRHGRRRESLKSHPVRAREWRVGTRICPSFTTAGSRCRREGCQKKEAGSNTAGGFAPAPAAGG